MSKAMFHPNLYAYRSGAAPADARTLDADLCVYGATAAGVAAAVAATRLGRTAVPSALRARWAAWGLAADAFVATGGWPHQL